MGNAAMVTLAAAATLAGGTQHFVTYDTEQYDDAGFYNPATPTRFTVPAGVTRVRVGGCAQFNNIDPGLNARASIAKNGSITYPGAPFGTAAMPNPSPGQQPRVCLASGQIPVVEGDYFELSVQVGGETSYDLLGSHRNNFWIEDAS